MTEKKELKLTNSVVTNIQLMAPYLSRKQQYILYGRLLEMMKDVPMVVPKKSIS